MELKSIGKFAKGIGVTTIGTGIEEKKKVTIQNRTKHLLLSS